MIQSLAVDTFCAGELLIKHGLLNFSGPRSKSMKHLMDEIVSGESTLMEIEGKLLRMCNVVEVIIYESEQKKLRLIEQCRRMNGSYHNAFRENLAGKMQFWEDPYQCAKREIREELFDNKRVKVGKLTLLNTSEEIDTQSLSYPGLTTRRVIHFFELIIHPDRFSEKAYIETKNNGDITYFGWKSTS